MYIYYYYYVPRGIHTHALEHACLYINIHYASACVYIIYKAREISFSYDRRRRRRCRGRGRQYGIKRANGFLTIPFVCVDRSVGRSVGRRARNG